MTTTASPSSQTLAIEGMTCAACVGRVERALSRVPGVSHTAVNLTTGLASVTADGADPAQLVAAVEQAGYHATSIDAKTSATQAVADITARAQEHLAGVQRRLAVGVLASVPVLLIDLVHTRLVHIHSPQGLLALGVAQLLLATVVVVYTGGPFFRGAWKVSWRPNMDTLVALGAGTAYIYSLVLLALQTFTTYAHEAHSELHAAVTIIALVTLGKFLEARAKRSANAAVAGLAQQAAQTATLVLLDGTTRTVPAEQIATGDRVQVLAHQTVPVDGELLEGAGSLDASIVTGESTPVELSRSAGAATLVPGGTTLLDGRIVLRATSTAATSTVARIVQLVQNAQASKTQIQALADKVAGIFTPIVLGLALITLAAWLLTGHDPAAALIATIATIVIACPCAMGLATPTAITVATGRAAKLGILFTQARALETARTITTVLFDKTGTLTEGRLQVIDTVVLAGEQNLLQLAASIEQFSTHPLAQAIVAQAQAGGLTLLDPESFNSVPGGGVKARLNGRAYAGGSLAFVESLGVEHAAGPRVERLQATGQTIVAIAELPAEGGSAAGQGGGRLLGLIGLRDTLRADAAETLATLRAAGIRVGVVSGDTEPAVRGALGPIAVDVVLANVRPEQKAAVVGEYARQARVAFVGDGVNDAPALAAADLGITMASGTDVAKAAGDVILLSGRLTSIPQTLVLARATIRVIKQNLVWAFGYNVAAIPLAMLGILPPGVAAAAMVLSSVSVVTNALRLYRVRL